MNRYFAIALACALVAVGGVVLYGLGHVTEPAARLAFGAGFLAACLTLAVAWTKKASERRG
jgi:hypothetical protein